MRIKITSKLDKANAARLRRRADRYWNENNVSPVAFARVPGGYAPLHEDEHNSISQAHAVARHMMVVAAQTFDYEVK